MRRNRRLADLARERQAAEVREEVKQIALGLLALVGLLATSWLAAFI
jgi:hypothetical protein